MFAYTSVCRSFVHAVTVIRRFSSIWRFDFDSKPIWKCIYNALILRSILSLSRKINIIYIYSFFVCVIFSYEITAQRDVRRNWRMGCCRRGAAGVDPGICVRGPYPPLLSPSLPLTFPSIPYLPLPLEVGPFKPAGDPGQSPGRRRIC